MSIPTDKIYSSERLSLPETVVQCLLYSSLLLSGSLLNLSIIWLVWTQKSLQTIVNMWVFSLCVSQLLVSMFLPFAVISTAANQWIFGKEFCFIFGYLTFLFRTVSIFSVAGIALNRYHVISRPFSQRVKWKTAKILIAFVWWSAAIVCILPLFGIGLFRYSSTYHMCQFSWNLGGSTLFYTSFYITAVFVSTLLTTSWSYLLIYKITKTHVNNQVTSTISRSKSDNYLNFSTTQAQKHNSSSPKPNRFQDLILLRHNFVTTRDQASSQSRVNLDERAGKLIAIIIFVFVIAWTPYFILAVYSAASGRLRSFTSATRWTEFIIMWLSLTPCVLDPLFYGVYTKKFKRHFQKHFCFWKKAKEDSMAMDIARKLSGDPGKQERRAYVKNKDLPGLASNNSRRKNN